MLRDIDKVELLGGYRLRLTFDDGVAGVVDVQQLISFSGVFAVLADESEFAQVFVHPELRTICWPNGADLDPDVLYAAATGKRYPGEDRAA